MKTKKELGSFDYAVSINRWSMKLLGLWPLDARFSNVKCALNGTIATIFVLPLFARLVTVTGWKSIMNQALRTIPFFPLLMRFIFVKARSENLRVILNIMAIDWANYPYLSKRKRQIMAHYARKGRGINVICIAWITLSLTVYMLMPLVNARINNFSWNETNRKLPSEGLYPFPFEQSPAFEMLYTAHWIVAYFCGMAMFSVDCFLCIIVFHACGQFDILAMTLERYNGFIKHGHTKDTSSFACTCLSCIVRRHVHITKYMDIIERSFNNLVLLQLLGNSFSLVLQGYELTTYAEDNNVGGIITFIVYTITLTYNVFVYCYVGECIIEKSENIGKVAYNLNWNHFSRTCALSVMLLIVRSRIPCKITAGKFAIMSLSYYKKILMTSISYVSVLKAIK